MICFFFLMIGQPPRSTLDRSSAASDVYKRQAAGLRALGLGKGDAIGLFLPMIPEVVIALLAIAKIGGVILPLFSGYGAGAVANRLADGEAKALFTACLLYTSPSPRDRTRSRMPSSA